MTKKTRLASAVQHQEKRDITRMVRMVLCAVVMILLTVSAGFADPLPNDPSVDWSIADSVLTLKPSEGYETGTITYDLEDQIPVKYPDWPWEEASGSVTAVKIEGCINVTGSAARMFQGLSNVTSFEGLKNLNMSQATNISYMFAGCTSLTDLDLSSFGKLEKLKSAFGFLAGCTGLKTLNMDNLDISSIPSTPPKINNKSMPDGKVWWADDSGEKKVIPSLEKLSAKDSKIWLTAITGGINSNRNSQLSLMCHDKDGEEICNRMWFTPDIGAAKAPAHMKYKDGKILLNVREWDDLTTDRWTTTLDSIEQGLYDQEGPDFETNPNVAANIGGNSANGHTNINGSGFLAPGIYEVTDEENTYWDKLPATYYRIVDIGVKPPVVTINGNEIETGTYKELEATVTDDVIMINSITFPRSVITKSVTYELKMDPIVITYPEAVKDIYGNVKDIRLTINGVTFTDQDHIPLNCSGTNYVREECSTPGRRNETGTSVLRKNDLWFRKLFTIRQDSLAFTNLIRTERYDDGNSDVRKMGSGAEVEFTIEVVDPEANTTILIYFNDIDLPREQVNQNNWYAWNADGSYNGIVYGEHSEGIQLLEGNDLNERSITFAKHSGVEMRDIFKDGSLAGKWILGTGSDRDEISPWSSVYVRAHADGAHYVWTNGNGCTTYMLKNTPEFPEIDPVIVLPEARKLLDGAAPKDDYFKAFNFRVEDAKELVREVEVPGLEKLTNRTAPMSPLNPEGRHTNRGDDIYFGYIRYDAPTVSPHKAAYVYKITEKQGEDPAIIYDTETVFYAQVIISGPVTEEELARGTRADIYMGEQHCEKDGNCGDIIWDRDIPVTVWSSDMTDTGITTPVKDCGFPHQVLTDANGKRFYRHDGKFLTYDPDDPEAEGESLTPVSSALSDTRHQISCEGLFKDLNVFEDRNLVEYAYDAASGKYYSPFCHELTEGIDVWPDPADKPVMEKLVASVPKHEGKSGNGYIVHKTEDEPAVEYYSDGDHYYSVIGTMMPVSANFNPKDSDPVVYIEDEILLEEETGRLFYYSDNRYFIYREDPLGEYEADALFELDEKTVDASDIPVSGTFRNYTKNTLTVEKHTVGGKPGTFSFTVLFDNKNFPEDGKMIYEFCDPDTGTLQKAADWSAENNLWEFSLEGGQELSIHNIPEETEYTVTEIPSTDGFAFVSADESRGSYSVTGTIDPEKPAEHFFDNALTEVTVEKKVVGTDKAFPFTAKLEISGLLPQETFYYGIKGQQLESGTAGADGTAQASLDFELSDQGKAVLIVPYGTNVTITEETDSGYTTHVHTETSHSEPVDDHSISLSAVKEDTAVLFTNSQEKESLSISKEVQGNGASETKYFKFDLHFEQAGAGTVLTLDMSNADTAPEQTEDTVYSADDMREANSRDDDPDTPGQQIICGGEHGEADLSLYLRHGQNVKIAGIPYDTDYRVQENEEDYTPGVRIHGDTVTDDENRPEPIDTSAGNLVEDLSLTGDTEIAFRNTLYKEDPEPEPEPGPEPGPEPEPRPTFFRLPLPLPETGFSALRPQPLAEKPLSLNYQPLGWTVQIPVLSVQTELVRVPAANGKYAVTWLGNAAGLLEGSALPGEGRAVIAGHNHLNTTEAGPFALLRDLETDDRIFVLTPSGELKAFSVYANQKIAEDDTAGLERIANARDHSLTFITCEDERPEGGYAARRIVAAAEIGE